MNSGTYIIKETQNLQSEREGYKYSGTLTAAKRTATKNQYFCGTVLKIEDETGNLIAFKEDGSQWSNAEGCYWGECQNG